MENRAQDRSGVAGGALWGRVLCAAGIILAIIGAYFVSIALGAVGLFLGIAGYFLGTRNLGLITIILGVVSIFVGLLMGQGVMAGSYDRAVDGWFREIPAEQIRSDKE